MHGCTVHGVAQFHTLDMKRLTYIIFTISTIALIVLNMGIQYLHHHYRIISLANYNYLIDVYYFTILAALVSAIMGIIVLLTKQKSKLDWILLPLSAGPLIVILIMNAT